MNNVVVYNQENREVSKLDYFHRKGATDAFVYLIQSLACYICITLI